ncbi:MAG TPA: hypothetical protein VGX68_17740 [Thermoanaerobaculia bacterium]|jgi:hypothetical protein|nr:hypothetical protein [Thermoanaerobaculia bacterium]
MALIVRAFPVLPGKESELRRFAAEMAGDRRSEAAAFYRSFGVIRESWHLQHTEHGAWIIGVTELTEDLETKAQAYATSQRPFDRWFKDQVEKISGINQDIEPLGPPTETLFAWSDR